MRWREAFARRTEFRFEYRLTRPRAATYRWVLEVGVPRFAGGEFLGLRRHRHGHPRAQADGGRAAQVRGELPRPGRQRAGDDLDDRRARARDVRQRGLAAPTPARRSRRSWATTWALGVHPDDAPSGASSAWDDGARAARAVGARVPAARRSGGEYRWIVERGVPRYEEGRFVGYVGTAIDIHERKLMEAQLREVYEREHTIAETLQRSLLPERLPRIEGLEIAARYLPAGAGRRGGRRLVRRARAARRPGGARGRRRGRPRPARRGGDGPAAQRLPRLRAGRELARPR